MSLEGIRATLLLGETLPRPASPPVLEALDSIQVSHSDEGRSGFQLKFKIGRSGAADREDYDLMRLMEVKPFSRAVVMVTLNAMPHVLMDGLITHRQFSPGGAPGQAVLTVTGEDVSLAMDLEERVQQHTAQPDHLIAGKLIATYAQYGLAPTVIPPASFEAPNPQERVPVQTTTDLQYIQSLAKRHGYVFYVTPGPAPTTNLAYWGPPERTSPPQPALTANMGPASNVVSISFRHNALATTRVEGDLKDPKSNRHVKVSASTPRVMALAAEPDWQVYGNTIRLKRMSKTGPSTEAFQEEVQSAVDRSVEKVVTASGELDTVLYNDLLRPRGVVAVRGCGFAHDGLYYVKSVSHALQRGQYKQQFTLTREGLGALSPVVPV